MGGEGGGGGIFEKCEWTDSQMVGWTDGRTTNHGHTRSSPGEQLGSGELKTHKKSPVYLSLTVITVNMKKATVLQIGTCWKTVKTSQTAAGAQKILLDFLLLC